MSKNKHKGPRRPRRGLAHAFTMLVVGLGLTWVVLVATGCVPHRWHLSGLHGGRHELSVGVSHMLDRLEANAEQRAAANAVVAELKPQLDQWRREREVLTAELRVVLGAERIEPQAAAELKTRILDLAEQSLSRSMEAVLALAEVLGPEQRGELLEFWQNHGH